MLLAFARKDPLPTPLPHRKVDSGPGSGAVRAQAGSEKERIVMITKRDLLIMKVGLEQYFMTLDLIARMFFPKSRNILQVPMKKVRELVHAGYLETIRLRVGEKRLYVTTKKGAKLLKEKKLSNGLRAVKKINDKTWEHDEIVMEVRVLFQTLLGFTEWTAERVLKKQNVRKKVPDALVSNGQENYVIEVEISLKNKRYYERVLIDLCFQYSQEDAILYIMKDETDMKWLMNQAKCWGRIYFTTLEDLRSICCGVTFTNSRGEELYLPRLHKGSVLFHDPENPNRNFDLDCEDHNREEPANEEFDRWVQEEEEARRRYEEEEKLRKEETSTG